MKLAINAFSSILAATTMSGAIATTADATNIRDDQKGQRTSLAMAETASAHDGDAQTRDRSNSEEQINATSSQRRGRGVPNIEEIVVTAQKREERLQDVPISISVLGGSDLDASSAVDANEVLGRVPGVTSSVAAVQGGPAQIVIRGVAPGLSLFSGASTTGYYLDSMPFGLATSAIAPDPDVYDLDRIEVLRGPQGTLYGANALNGVVRVLTKDADPGKFDLKSRALFSATEQGGDNVRADAAINVPIIDGKLAVRGVVGYQDFSGWIDKPNIDQENANDTRRRTARLKLGARPIEGLSIDLVAWLSRSDYGALSTSADGRHFPGHIHEPFVIDYDAYTAKIGYDFPLFSLISTTSYLDYLNDSTVDGTPHLPSAFPVDTTLDSNIFTQEVYLSSRFAANWRWTAGGIYRDATDGRWQYLPSLSVVVSNEDVTSESWAVFGELTRIFLDGKLEFTAGVRHFRDEVTHKPAALPPSTDDFHATTPRFVLNWKPRDELAIYASYAEGFRSGLEQTAAVRLVAPTLPAAQPDTLKNYEVGGKGSLFGERFGYEVALYYIDWQDVQTFISVANPTSGAIQHLVATTNGVSASGIGADLALTARPTEGLELGINMGWNDLQQDGAVIDSLGRKLYSEGERLPFSAELTGGVSADYEFPVGDNGFSGRLSASANYTSSQILKSSAGAFFGTLGKSDNLLIGRLSFAIDAPDRWAAALFVDNVNNEHGTPFQHPTVREHSVRIRPRTIGVQLEYRL